MSEDSLLERVTAAANERQLSQNRPTVLLAAKTYAKDPLQTRR
jgi:hypothetical protein